MTEGGYFIAAAVLAALIVTISQLLQPRPLEAKRHKAVVDYVIDGDTIILKDTGTRLRLWGINAAEKGESTFYEAKAALEKLVLNRTITYTDEGHDNHGRTVARVFVRGREVQKLMLKAELVTEVCRYSRGLYGQC